MNHEGKFRYITGCTQRKQSDYLNVSDSFIFMGLTMKPRSWCKQEQNSLFFSCGSACSFHCESEVRLSPSNIIYSQRECRRCCRKDYAMNWITICTLKWTCNWLRAGEQPLCPGEYFPIFLCCYHLDAGWKSGQRTNWLPDFQHYNERTLHTHFIVCEWKVLRSFVVMEWVVGIELLFFGIGTTLKNWAGTSKNAFYQIVLMSRGWRLKA